MREIVLDTETTGFDPHSGDRLVEIGAIELFNHMPTGRTYHQYINPQRDMPDGAFGVHGIGPDLLTPPRAPKDGEVTLKDKPLFKAVGQAFLDFIGPDSKLVIHNASFDMKFLNAELKWIGLPEIPFARALDTLAMARKKFPGSPATLDALCRRFGIDNSSRTLHGALLVPVVSQAARADRIAVHIIPPGCNSGSPTPWFPSSRRRCRNPAGCPA